MRRIWGFFTLALCLGSGSPTALAVTHYAEISGSSALAENGCPAWTLEGNDDDCSYNAGNPLGFGSSQWIGPIFSAGYYAPGNAPPVFVNSTTVGPVLAPAPELPLDGMRAIPIERGFISIDDRDTVQGFDDVIAGTFEFGAFERNVSVSAGVRLIESIQRISHRLVPVRVSSATANGGGGFDYVAAASGAVSAFPELLSGSTSSNGGFADEFPSQVASQSRADPGDLSYWSAPGSRGIARLDGDATVLGTRTIASVWGYQCNTGQGLAAPDASTAFCGTVGLNWDGDSRASFSNVLLEISTNANGDITAARALLVGESDLSATAAGTDSWVATTLAFSGQKTAAPAAFDDRAIILKNDSPFVPADVAVLSNDLPGALPVTVSIESNTTAGTAEVVNNRVVYTPSVTQAEGDYIISYRITDADMATATADIQVRVTDVLLCTDDPATGEIAGTRNVPVVVPVLDNDTGFDLPPVTVRLTNAPAEEDGTTVVNPDRTVTFTPAVGGLFQIAYQLNDGANRPRGCIITVRVPALPQAVDDTAGTAEDSVKSIDVLANDLELSDTPLTLAITGEPAHGTASVDGSGTTPKILYTPANGYVGTDSISYRVTDADGALSNIALLTISVFGPPQNDLPACVNDESETEQGVPVTVDVLANDTGLNAAPVTVEVEGQFPGDAGATTVNPDNTITFTPTDAVGGTAFITYQAREALNNPVSCLLTVRVNDVPIAVSDNFDSINVGKTRPLLVIDNDTGLKDFPIAIEIRTQPRHGTLTVCNAVSAACPQVSGVALPYVLYAYTDADGFDDDDSADTFTYVLTDVDGDGGDEPATVTITPRKAIAAITDPDVLFSPRIKFTTASGYLINLDVLANDAGFFSRNDVSVAITSGPTVGIAALRSDKNIDYTPPDDFVGEVEFTYRITDAEGNSSSAQVIVDVYPAPVTDTGGSALDALLLVTLCAGLALRRRSPLAYASRSRLFFR